MRELTEDNNTNYIKSTKRNKRPTIYSPPSKLEDVKSAGIVNQKAERFAIHLENIFKLNAGEIKESMNLIKALGYNITESL